MKERDDLSINALELLGMVVTAWGFIVLGANTLQHPREPIFMHRDNLSAVHWDNHCGGGNEPRSGTLMRILGCLETGSGWCFQAKHVKGMANTTADGLSGRDHQSIPSALYAFRPT